MRKTGIARTVLVSIICIAVAVALFAVVYTLFIGYFMAPKGWLFYEHSELWSILTMFLIICPCVVAWFMFKTENKKAPSKKVTAGKVKIKSKVLLALLWILVLYISFTNVTYVTENQIVCCSPASPTGIQYKYGDVSRVETGFGSKRFSVYDYKRKGNYSYTIYLKDRKIVFSDPVINAAIKRYEKTTYLELEEFDRKLMALNIPKKSSDRYAEDCDLAQEYVARFLRIINN